MHPNHKASNLRASAGIAWLCAASLAGCAVLASGCVAKRGVDFGHWARTGERINLIRVFKSVDIKPFSGEETILVLPAIGSDMQPEARERLRRTLQDELRYYFSARIVGLDSKGPLGEYLQESDLKLAGDFSDMQEMGRIGTLVGASHVLYVQVRGYRPYPPQLLNLCLTLVETSTLKPAVELNASFDAGEQQVVLALGDYLQSRRARHYDTQNLDIMLNSPGEYSDFVSSACGRALADATLSDALLKKRLNSTDIKRGM